MPTHEPDADRPGSSIPIRPLLQAVRDQYLLSWTGTHGVGHWARVHTNGIELAAGTGADPLILFLFAVFHDACRHNEASDDDHGGRRAELALRYRGRFYELDDRRFSLLYEACSGHTIGRWHPEVTVQACWDSDRLDLARVGILPNPSRLGSDAARSLIVRASERARGRTVPDFVDREWATIGRPRRPDPGLRRPPR